MNLVRYRAADGEVRVGVVAEETILRLPCPSIADFLSGDLARCRALVDAASTPEAVPVELLAPVDGLTEVWAAGVTYLRSRDARIEESHEPDVYDRVYAAERPELFFKSVAWRVRGTDSPIAIRADSPLNVPEPELAMLITASGEIAGYTICNDVSSRSFEGENPLYLPQAKVYNGSCALGPSVLLAWHAPDEFAISCSIQRNETLVFQGETSSKQLARPLADLAGWLYAGLDFPAGAVLSTGTGIVPDMSFTLEPGDEVAITIGGIGTLTNIVVRETTERGRRTSM